MEFKDLVFFEIDEHTSQAVVNIKDGYKIQIIKNELSGNSECNLYTPQGSILDSVEDEDQEGVEYFIKISKDLMKDILFWDNAINDDAIFIPYQS